MSHLKTNISDTIQFPADRDLPNPYLADLARIEEITIENDNINTYRVKPMDLKTATFHHFKPGQFAIWSLPGVGEAPFSYSSISIDGQVEFTIHRVGRLTNAIHRLKTGDVINIRGPYGNGFPMDKMRDKNLLFVMGGIGSAPLRSVLQYVLKAHNQYGRICVFHGAREPDEMLFQSEFERYIDDPRLNCMLTVDSTAGHDDWEDEEGVVTTLLDKYMEEEADNLPDPTNSTALICGPPVMYTYVIEKLLLLDIDESNIYMTLERRMKCGIGKCGHCIIDFVYTCEQGPVFTYWDAKYFKEVIS